MDCFSLSLDGYGAGPNQRFDTPLGVGGEALHDWFVVTRSFHQVTGQDGGETGVDDDFAARGAANLVFARYYGSQHVWATARRGLER